MQKTSLFLVVLLCAFFPFFLPACYVVPGGGAGVSPAPGNGPPPHAPAHGYRRNHVYRYYPSAQVYFSPDRNAYFYLDGSTWRMSASLPLELQVRLGDHVTIEMESDTPYRDFDTHRSKYPPGKNKKKR